MLEVNEKNLMSWIEGELKYERLEISEEKKRALVKEAIEIYENQILTLESRTEALDVMQGLILQKIEYGLI